MREIKFRAWIESEDTGYRVAIVKRIFFAGNFSHVMLEDDNYEYQIDNCYLTQFTGLRDKNGKEIYEGDIVQYKETTRCGDDVYIEIGQVEYHNGCFYPLPINDECEDDWYSIYREDYEVIGNIYENPELLKDTEK